MCQKTFIPSHINNYLMLASLSYFIVFMLTWCFLMFLHKTKFYLTYATVRYYFISLFPFFTPDNIKINSIIFSLNLTAFYYFSLLVSL